MAFVLKTNYIKELILFSSVFFLNIGLKEVFRWNDDSLLYVLLIVSLSIFAGFFFINVPLKFIGIYAYSFFFYLFLLASALTSINIEYGLMKAFLGIYTPLLAFRIFLSYKKWTKENVVVYLITTVMIIDLIGLIYKAKVGLFNRGDSFGLLGPIPFGWVNGMALVGLSQKKTKGIIDFLLMGFFLLMIVWCGSKGPLLSFLILALITHRKIIGNSIKTKVLMLLLVLLASGFIVSYWEDIRAVRAAIAYFENPEEYAEGAGEGSIGSRKEYISISIQKFYKNPLLGVGLGDWNTSGLPHKYPHNVYLEVLSEIGVIGLILFVFILFKVKFYSSFGYITIFILIAICFSGDISYFRYSFLPLLISYYFKKSLNE